MTDESFITFTKRYDIIHGYGYSLGESSVASNLKPKYEDSRTKQNSYAAVQSYNIEYRNTGMEHKSKLVNKKETIHCPIGAFEILLLLLCVTIISPYRSSTVVPLFIRSYYPSEVSFFLVRAHSPCDTVCRCRLLT